MHLDSMIYSLPKNHNYNLYMQRLHVSAAKSIISANMSTFLNEVNF